MAAEIRIRLADDVAEHLGRRAQAEGKTLPVFAAEALKKLVEQEAQCAADASKDLQAPGLMEQLLFIRASLYLIAEHSQGGAFIPKPLLTKIYEAAKKSSRDHVERAGK